MMTQHSIEKTLLRYGLILGVFYQLYQCTFDAITEAPVTAIFINLIVTLFFLLLLFLTRLEKSNNIVSTLLHVALLPAFVYFWYYNNGILGVVPMILCAYIGFIIATTSGLIKWIAVVVYTLTILTMIFFPSVLGKVHQPEMNLSIKSVDYFIVAIIITCFTFFLKGKYLYYRNLVAIRNTQLQNIAVTLTQQNEELRLRQEELKSINDNLESIIAQHTKGIETKNKELAEYAFINAHMLRAPLSRILGLTNLMESEANHYDLEQIKQIKLEAVKIDHVIRKINEVLI